MPSVGGLIKSSVFVTALGLAVITPFVLKKYDFDFNFIPKKIEFKVRF